MDSDSRKHRSRSHHSDDDNDDRKPDTNENGVITKEEEPIVHDDFEDTELDSDVEYSEGDEDADKQEEEMLSMPALQSVLSYLNPLKSGRRLIAHPVSVADLANPKMIELIASDYCEEMKMQFIRPASRVQELCGFLLLTFSSTRYTKQALETLLEINPQLVVTCEKDASNANMMMDHWIREEKGTKRWTDTLLYIKNVAPSVTKQQLEDLFYDSDDIVINEPTSVKPRAKDAESKENESEPSLPPKEAFAMYRTIEAAQAASREYASKVIELDGHQLKVFKYHVPVHQPPRGYLRLKERRAVLKYIDRLTTAIEAGKDEGAPLTPDWCATRLTTCQNLIDQDDKFRTGAGLPVLSLSEIRAFQGVKVIKGADRKELLLRLGVLPRPRHSAGSRHADDSRDSRSRDSRDRKRRYDYSNYRSSGSSREHHNSSILGNPPSLIGLCTSVTPFSLMMQANQWGMMGVQDGILGPGGISPLLNAAMLGGSAGMGDLGPRKMLRLDASGSYHVADAADSSDTSRKSSGSRDHKSSSRKSDSSSKLPSLLDL